MDAELIGKFISEQRKKKNMTQKELADQLLVTSQAVSKWENGRGIPDIEMLKKLSEVFELDIDELINAKENIKAPQNKKLLFIIPVCLLLIGIGLYILIKPNETFTFSSLASDNEAFQIKGVIASSKNKKSIYISEVTYDNSDEEEYKNIECILYEASSNYEKKIGQWGNIETKENNTYLLTELLKGIEFNIDDYDCTCYTPNCDNLYLRINALNENDKIITYNIPIEIDNNCDI